MYLYWVFPCDASSYFGKHSTFTALQSYYSCSYTLLIKLYEFIQLAPTEQRQQQHAAAMLELLLLINYRVLWQAPCCTTTTSILLSMLQNTRVFFNWENIKDGTVTSSLKDSHRTHTELVLMEAQHLTRKPELSLTLRWRHTDGHCSLLWRFKVVHETRFYLIKINLIRSDESGTEST